MPWKRAQLVSALTFACALALASPAATQETDELAMRRAEKAAELERVSADIALSRETMTRLISEIVEIRKDGQAITAALIQAAKTEKKLSEDIDEIGERLMRLREEEDVLRMSLASRRGALAEVLGALQRMGLNPPPAILVTPEDALSSVRSAILLGAVVPEMRAETEALAGEMARMAALGRSIEEERGRLSATVANQIEEKQRLRLLLEEKEKLRTASEDALASERTRGADLAERAESLNRLIAELEKEAERRQAEATAAAEAERRRAVAEDRAPVVVPDENRLVASVPFGDLRGKLPFPAYGQIKYRFGEADAAGGTWHGDTLATQSGAIVTAPSDATVLYAGPFRSYGQLLILDAGDGYLILLAGMGRISAAPDHEVMAGEPVGAMVETQVASTVAIASENAEPELYVEFRKDGKPVDPSPWWADGLSGRTANGT